MITAITVLLFIPPIWMLSKGWPIRAGLAMLLAVLLPIAAMLAAYDDLPPGVGMVLFAAIPFLIVAMLVLAGGIIAAAVRLAKRHSSVRGL